MNSADLLRLLETAIAEGTDVAAELATSTRDDGLAGRADVVHSLLIAADGVLRRGESVEDVVRFLLMTRDEPRGPRAT